MLGCDTHVNPQIEHTGWKHCKTMYIANSMPWNDRSKQSMWFQISEQSELAEFCFGADLGLAAGWRNWTDVLKIGADSMKDRKPTMKDQLGFFPTRPLCCRACWDHILNHKSSSVATQIWNVLITQIWNVWQHKYEMFSNTNKKWLETQIWNV